MGGVLFLLLCLGFFLFYSDFAEVNIQLSFLDFPIFISEIILFFCFVLFLIGQHFRQLRPASFAIGIWVFFVWVLLKAGWEVVDEAHSPFSQSFFL